MLGSRYEMLYIYIVHERFKISEFYYYFELVPTSVNTNQTFKFCNIVEQFLFKTNLV